MNQLHLQPLLFGLLATLVAALQLCAWVAVGSLFLRRSRAAGVRLAGGLLLGGAITAALLAVASWLAAPRAGIAIVLSAGLAALLLRRAELWRIGLGFVAEYRRFVGKRRLLRWSLLGMLSILWIAAIAPPREADAMRYHLAHIRQILQDGVWEHVRDSQYAMPFGWSINYMPFEWMGLPQAAQLVNLGLLLIIVSGLLGLLRRRNAGLTASLFCVAAFAHPFILKTFTAPTADAYAIFVVYAIVLMMLTAREAEHGLLLGFVSIIGVQSRYQMLIVATASTLCLVACVTAQKLPLSSARRFAAGALGAAALASPFYVANLLAFGNAVWPIFEEGISLGTVQPLGRLEYVARLFGLEMIAPLPLAIVLLTLLAALTAKTSLRRLALFSGFFMLVWAIIQPTLDGRTILLLLPVTATLGSLMIAWLVPRGRYELGLRYALAGTVTLYGGLAFINASDDLRYALTGDARSFHRYTWYYPVYDWINRQTDADARFLLVVQSGHSYYLDRSYTRADPWLTQTIDWSSVGDGAALAALMDRGRYDYLIYHDQDWSDHPGGRAMSEAVADALKRRSLVPVRVSDELLYRSRVRREAELARILVLRRVQSATDHSNPVWTESRTRGSARAAADLRPSAPPPAEAGAPASD